MVILVLIVYHRVNTILLLLISSIINYKIYYL